MSDDLEAKHWSRSRTVLFNVGISALGIVAIVVDALQPHVAILREVIPNDSGATLVIVLAVANILLRLATSTGIRIRKPKISQPPGEERRRRGKRRTVTDQQPTGETPHE